MQHQKLLETAIRAAIEGGIAILDVYNNEQTQVEYKEDNSPLTQADKRCNDVIMTFLANTNVPVLSEEGRDIAYAERAGWEFLWVVDPLDGTKEFIKRNGEFTVNIALIQNGSPILGVIYVPVTGDLYFGSEGIGAYKVENIDGTSTGRTIEDLMQAGHALPRKIQKPFTVVGSRSHMNDETANFIKQVERERGQAEIMSRGSSLKICMVAEGKADVYPRFAPTMEWDTAAGHAIAKYAGFEMYLHDRNEPLKYNKENLLNPWFVVKERAKI